MQEMVKLRKAESAWRVMSYVESFSQDAAPCSPVFEASGQSSDLSCSVGLTSIGCTHLSLDWCLRRENGPPVLA